MIAVVPVTSTGPKYGIELKMPASRPHSAACSRPIHANASQRRDADQRAGGHLHEQEPFNLPVDLLEDLHA